MRKKPLALRRLGRFYLSDLHGIRREHRLEDRFTFYVKRVQIFATGSRSLFARQQTSAHIRLRVVNRSFPYFLRGKNLAAAPPLSSLHHPPARRFQWPGDGARRVFTFDPAIRSLYCYCVYRVTFRGILCGVQRAEGTGDERVNIRKNQK